MCLDDISIYFDVHNNKDNELFIPDILSTNNNVALSYESSIIFYYALRLYLACVKKRREEQSTSKLQYLLHYILGNELLKSKYRIAQSSLFPIMLLFLRNNFMQDKHSSHPFDQNPLTLFILSTSNIERLSRNLCSIFKVI